MVTVAEVCERMISIERLFFQQNDRFVWLQKGNWVNVEYNNISVVSHFFLKKSTNDNACKLAYSGKMTFSKHMLFPK